MVSFMFFKGKPEYNSLMRRLKDQIPPGPYMYRPTLIHTSFPFYERNRSTNNTSRVRPTKSKYEKRPTPNILPISLSLSVFSLPFPQVRHRQIFSCYECPMVFSPILPRAPSCSLDISPCISLALSSLLPLRVKRPCSLSPSLDSESTILNLGCINYYKLHTHFYTSQNFRASNSNSHIFCLNEHVRTLYVIIVV